jgi:Zn-dependent M16 (insulinase) family peptidase
MSDDSQKSSKKSSKKREDKEEEEVSRQSEKLQETVQEEVRQSEKLQETLQGQPIQDSDGEEPELTTTQDASRRRGPSYQRWSDIKEDMTGEILPCGEENSAKRIGHQDFDSPTGLM